MYIIVNDPPPKPPMTVTEVNILPCISTISNILKEVELLLARRATVRKEVLEELKEAVEVKLGNLKKQEQEEKEGEGDMDPLVAHKSRMREEVKRQMKNILETVDSFETRACHCESICDKITMWHQRYVNV